VLNSVTRSHADGTVALVAVNVGLDALPVSVPVDPGLRSAERAAAAPEAVLYRMDEAGAMTETGRGTTLWSHTSELQPAEVLFLVLK